MTESKHYPFGVDEPILIEFADKGEGHTCYAVYATNKAVLINSFVVKPDVSVTLPCGNTYEIKDFADIPEGDLPCPCGNPTHFFVKYEGG